MNPIHIEFDIPDPSLFIGFGLLVFAITAYLAISHNRGKLKRMQHPLQWLGNNYVYILIPLGLLAIGLAVVFWIWAIRGEIGRIIDLLGAYDDPESIRNLAYAIGALLAAVALSATIPFQLIKVWVNERLAKTTEQGHMTDRITKAVEQLGAEKTIWEAGEQKTAPNLEVRLGAIYALERIAQDSMRDHIPVMEILTAYVRHNAPAEGAAKIEVDYESKNWRQKLNEEITKIGPPPIDIQAILTVIGRRKPKHIAFEWNAHANPIKSQYRLDLRSTNLQKLNLGKSSFDYALISESELQGTNYSDANLVGTDLSESKIQGADFKNTILMDANFRWANVQATVFISAKLEDADLRKTNLKGAVFNGANLRGTDFSKANLQAGILNEAIVNAETKLTDTILFLTSVKNVDLSQVAELSDEQIQSMFGDCTTKLPASNKFPEWMDWSPSRDEFRKQRRIAISDANHHPLYPSPYSIA